MDCINRMHIFVLFAYQTHSWFEAWTLCFCPFSVPYCLLAPKQNASRLKWWMVEHVKAVFKSKLQQSCLFEMRDLLLPSLLNFEIMRKIMVQWEETIDMNPHILSSNRKLYLLAKYEAAHFEIIRAFIRDFFQIS